MIYKLILILFIVFFPLFVSMTAAAGQSPTQVIEQLQHGIQAVDVELTDADNDTATFDRRVTALTPLIENTHDLAYMARMTIKSHWNTLDDDQRKQFVGAFSELSVANYASRFRDLANVKFRTLNERPMSRGRVEIRTELSEENADSVALDYVLHETPSGWRIINILADGVSELAMKRTQYQQIFKTQDFAALVRHLQQQRYDLRQEEPTD